MKRDFLFEATPSLKKQYDELLDNGKIKQPIYTECPSGNCIGKF